MRSQILERRERYDAKNVYLVLMGAQAVCFSLFFTIQLIYQVTVVELNPFQMVLVGTVLEVTWVLCEIPTGVIADVISRRLSIITGVALMGWSYTLEGGVPEFWAALLSQVFWGIGGTCTSGAIQAWITDEVGEDTVGLTFLRGSQMRLIGIMFGTIACIGLGLIHTQLPMVVAGAGMFALCIVLMLVMPEHFEPQRKETIRSTTDQMKETAFAGVTIAMSRPVVRMIILISLFVGLSAEAWDRLRIPSVIDRFEFPAMFGSNDPIIVLGLAGIVGTLLGLAVSELYKRVSPESFGSGAPARMLAMCSALQMFTLVVFAVSGYLWVAVGMMWMRTVVSTVSEPVESAWLNRNLDSSTRATVNSMASQANSFGQVAGGLAMGWIANTFSIRAALIGSAIILSPTIGLYRRLVVRDQPELETAGSTAD